MIIPRFYIGSLLLFWGIETHNYIIAIILAFLAESAGSLKEKYTLSENDFIRLSDLTSVVFLTAIGLILLNKPPIFFFSITTSWLPVIIAPLLLAQLYSTTDKIVIGTRFGTKRVRSFRHQPVDIRYSYLFCCIFGAGSANSGSSLFFPVLIFLLCWLLYENRGKGYKLIIFLLLGSTAAALGYTGYTATKYFHTYFNAQHRSFWRYYYTNKYADPFQTNLTYGSLGHLKLSGNILMRVNTEENEPPERLHIASYNMFIKNTWHNIKRPFRAADLATESSWHLYPEPHPESDLSSTLTIEQNLPKEKGLLARPANSFLLYSANLFELQQNRSNTLKAIDSAPVVESTFHYTKNISFQKDIPDKRNLHLPEKENPGLTLIAKKLWSDTTAPKDRVEAITRFFANGFAYTLELQDEGNEKTVLDNFLLTNRRGHCELFATATTLLLRKAEIPSRYVTGYWIEEFSTLEKRYVIRARHAHAWSEYYLDGSWHILDTTPSSWLQADRQHSSFLEPVKDLYRYLRQKYRIYQIGTEDDSTLELSILLVVLSSILIYRIYRNMQASRQQKAMTGDRIRQFLTPASPFYQLIEKLEKQSNIPRKNTAYPTWINMVCKEIDINPALLDRIYQLHLKLRFDTKNFTEKELDELELKVKEMIEKYT